MNSTPTLKAPAHHCAVCPKEIQRGYLMCVAHWRLVPQELQQKVYHTWSRAKRARGCSGYDAALRAEYATTRRQAIEAVSA